MHVPGRRTARALNALTTGPESWRFKPHPNDTSAKPQALTCKPHAAEGGGLVRDSRQGCLGRLRTEGWTTASRTPSGL